MVFDFSRIKPKREEEGVVDPIELFQKLKVSDPNINDLWLAQGDALRQWHLHRNKGDVGIVLNTGAGKTLVGLLIAQSLVNETKGKVLYTCSSIQLIEQTAEKACGYGLDVTTYYRGKYSNDLYHMNKVPCVTSYHALFNGRSVFPREEIAAVVLDDAHVAEHLIRDQFSVHIGRTDFPDAYNGVTDLFKEYHKSVGLTGSYEELADASCRRLFLVPPFEVKRQFSELHRILRDAGLPDDESTSFAWEHLKDRVDLCCILVSSSMITITPPFVPVRTLKYFQSPLRRVYLSATLSASDAFARTFGCIPDHIIAPSTTAGECERLVLCPSKAKTVEKDVDIAKGLVEKEKTLILVPTYARAAEWADLVQPPPRNAVSEHVTAFKHASGSPKLLLAARYDGIDFPGDTCRIMIIDDLPTSMGPLERFIWDQLGLFNSMSTAIASRIVQSFGRISRGMSDHGVVILTGPKLIEWLLNPRNRAFLPAFLQRQIALGMEISDRSESIDVLASVMAQCLDRDKNWLGAYGDMMENQGVVDPQLESELLARLAVAEAEYACQIWRRNYESAAKCLNTTLEDAFDLSNSTGAWHTLWLGHALDLTGDNVTAIDMYRRAHGCNVNIPAYWSHDQKEPAKGLPMQAIEVARQFSTHDAAVSVPKGLHQELRHIDGSGSFAQVEESLRALGQYLGMNSSRPGKERETGPDVLWELSGFPALCMEVKTGKKSRSNYRKKDVGQLHDHVQWVKDNTDSDCVIPLFVGLLVGPTSTANPPPEFRVIALEQFHQLAECLIAALTDIAANAFPLTLPITVSEMLQERSLLWPACFDSLESSCLRDL
ncbi:MAG: DEAD/DEAH box helicase family protein [Phycisphaerae bacterium]|nr:DEAD/DEAH box helicase family protein [Phycisphaerae bacterium]